MARIRRTVPPIVGGFTGRIRNPDLAAGGTGVFTTPLRGARPEPVPTAGEIVRRGPPPLAGTTGVIRNPELLGGRAIRRVPPPQPFSLRPTAFETLGSPIARGGFAGASSMPSVFSFLGAGGGF